MNKLYLTLLLLTLIGKCQNSVQEYRNYQLISDDETNTYYLEMFAGTEMEKKLLLIDTQASGTAIMYDGKNSGNFVNHTDAVKVQTLDGTIEGFKVTDQICLDNNENICIDDFTFTMATEINYPRLKDTKIGGVIPFNQYMKSDDPTLRLVPALYMEEAFFQKTLQMDFKLKKVEQDGFEITEPSIITFNSDDKRNVRYKSLSEVSFYDNLMKDGKWLIQIQGAFLNEKSIFKEFESKNSNAVIATALNSIKLPHKDYQEVIDQLKQFDPEIYITKNDNPQIIGSKSCKHYSSKLSFFSLKIGSSYYKMPLIFFSQDVQGDCLFLFEKNDEYEKKKDSIVTDQGENDADSNNGYILGMPFLRAFMIFMDYEKNQIGFANKLNNFGAFITDDVNDNKGIEKKPYNPYKPDAKSTSGGGQDQQSKKRPWYKQQRKATQTETNDDDENSGGITIVVIISIGVIVACTLSILIYYCYRKRQENNKMFASEKPDPTKRAGKRRKSNEILTASFIERNNFAEF